MLYDNEIDHIEIYVDGTNVVDAIYGDARQDVDRDYPGREGAPNFGYVYDLETTLYPNGSHTLQAIAVNKAGNKATLTPESLAVIVRN